MEAFGQLFDAVSKNATGALLVLTLLALAAMYRRQDKRDADHRAEVQTLNDKHVATVERIVPMVQRFSDMAAAVLAQRKEG